MEGNDKSQTEISENKQPRWDIFALVQSEMGCSTLIFGNVLNISIPCGSMLLIIPYVETLW